MNKTTFAALLTGFATLAQAVKLTNSDFDVVHGQSFTIEWTDAEGVVSIRLKSGAANSLVTVEEIASGQSGGSYTWSVPSNLEAGQYAIEIEDDSGNVNYSVQFPISGDGGDNNGSQTMASVAESAPATAAETDPTTAAGPVPTPPPPPPPKSAQTTASGESPSTTKKDSTETPTPSQASEASKSDVPNSAPGHSACGVARWLVIGIAFWVAYY